METGDGLLVRVHPPGGVMSAAACRLVADCAESFGNGLLDVTARGNLQIRGVALEGWPDLLARLDAAGLVEPDRDGPSRLTLLSPLAGIDPAERFDPRGLAAAVEAASSGVAGLPAKAFVTVDGGGLVPLDDAGRTCSSRRRTRDGWPSGFPCRDPSPGSAPRPWPTPPPPQPGCSPPSPRCGGTAVPRRGASGT
jgi:precorrin-3B synthase